MCLRVIYVSIYKLKSKLHYSKCKLVYMYADMFDISICANVLCESAFEYF